MTMRALLNCAAAAGLAALAGACAHEQDRTSSTPADLTTTTTTTGGAYDIGEDRVVPNDEAVEHVARVLCDRACASQPSTIECMKAARRTADKEIGVSSCPSGVRQLTLTTCLNALATAACIDEADFLQADPCNASNVCVSRR
jgi:hypothetical protein